METTGRGENRQMLSERVLARNALRAYIADSGVSMLKKRDCLETVQDYLRGREKRVLGLCGLHKTGRTTLLYQSIDTLGAYEESVLVSCLPGDSVTDIRCMLDEAGGRYLFVDDTDNVPEFAEQSGEWLADLVQSGKKVVLSGGDGDELVRMRENVLFDRLRLLLTSYVSFREYHRFQGVSLQEYFDYQSEQAGEYIRRIAEKYANVQAGDGRDDLELSVFLGETGKVLKSMGVLVEIPENGRSYHTAYTQPGLIKTTGAGSGNDDTVMRDERLKDIVVTDLLKDPVVSGSNVIAKYRSDGGEVFDIVLINKKNRRCVAIQVADTDQRAENQARDLTDKAVCKELQEYFGGRLVGRYVFYHGPAGRAFKVQYVNCTEFLSRGAVFWNMMEKLEGG